MHTVGSFAALREAVAAGRIKDRDEVTVGAMVTTVAFKTNAKGEPWAILYLEDLTDKMEALLMAAHFDPATRKRTRTFELFRHMALPDALLRVKGEVKVETVGGNGNGNGNGGGNGGDEDEEEQTTVKLFITGLESLEDFQGKGFTGAVVSCPGAVPGPPAAAPAPVPRPAAPAHRVPGPGRHGGPGQGRAGTGPALRSRPGGAGGQGGRMRPELDLLDDLVASSAAEGRRDGSRLNVS